MPLAAVNGIEINYEEQGDGPPVMLLSGLGGAGRGWGPHIGRFAQTHRTIVPDHRGTGDSSRLESGYTIEAHAEDMSQLLRKLETGPAHLVGSSTGGAIAQMMALEHPDVVRSLTLVSSWARADDFFRHQFAVRRHTLTELGREAYSETSALFLFSPEFFRSNYAEVRQWCERSATGPRAVEIMAQRIDMIVAFDVLDRLGEIDAPTHVLVGSTDGCTPPHFSRELADGIPGAELTVMEGGHLIYKEAPEAFHATVLDWLQRVDSQA